MSEQTVLIRKFDPRVRRQTIDMEGLFSKERFGLQLLIGDLQYYVQNSMEPVNDILNERKYIKEGINKPRIDIWAELTKKRNLSVLWFPTGFKEISEGGGWRKNDCTNTDFTEFRCARAAWRRPENEIMFIHDAWLYSCEYDKKYHGHEYKCDEYRRIAQDVVMDVWCNLVHDLSSLFEVTIRTDLQMVSRRVEDKKPHNFTHLTEVSCKDDFFTYHEWSAKAIAELTKVKHHE